MSDFATQVMHGAVRGRVLSCHARACNLLLHDGRAGHSGTLLALVLRGIGDGPLNLVVDGDTAPWARLDAGATIAVQDRVLRFDGFSIDTRTGLRWTARPAIAVPRLADAELAWLLRRACRMASCPGLLEALCPISADPPLHVAAVAALLRNRPSAILDWPQLASDLVGLGPGLTPAGDDFLAGAMIALHQFDPGADRHCQAMLRRCEGASTRLSLALLERAAQGQCSQAWHELLEALAIAEPAATFVTHRLEQAIRGVLAHGASSGADTLAGFLYAAGRMPVPA
ncbi:MAG: DUF2877 domain-containing protein [Pseudomonas sp.]